MKILKILEQDKQFHNEIEEYCNILGSQLDNSFHDYIQDTTSLSLHDYIIHKIKGNGFPPALFKYFDQYQSPLYNKIRVEFYNHIELYRIWLETEFINKDNLKYLPNDI